MQTWQKELRREKRSEESEARRFRQETELRASRIRSLFSIAACVATSADDEPLLVGVPQRTGMLTRAR
jgi:hypothetical protein